MVGLLFFLGLFFLGLVALRQGLLAMGGAGLAVRLRRWAGTPGRGFCWGLLTTALLQSSSAVTAAAVGLAGSGALPLAGAVGVVLGANIGTTATAQLVALRLARFAPPLLLASLLFYSRRPGRPAGLTLLGLGLLFAGLAGMETALTPLAAAPWFQTALTGASRPALALITAALATALVQSSSLVCGVVIALAARDLVSLETAIALVLGANVGTCLTSVLASLGAGRMGRQVAAVHLMLNVLGVLAFLPWLGNFAGLVALTATEASRQVANAHTLFNLVTSLAALPLAGQLAALARWLVRF